MGVCATPEPMAWLLKPVFGFVPEFVAGLMPGLELIDAKNALDVSIGSLNTVVGVVDTGIDPAHPEGGEHLRATKKEFCRMIQGAKELSGSADQDESA